MRFDVTIQRTAYREHVFTVEAENEDAAHDVAIEEACAYNFLDSPVSSAIEEVTGITPATPNSNREGKRTTMDTFYCDECGHAYSIEPNGVARHITEDGETDYDADADHVPYGEEPVVHTPNKEVSGEHGTSAGLTG